MSEKLLRAIGVAAVTALCWCVSAAAIPPDKKPPAAASVDAGSSKGLAAIKRAAETQKYAFLFFYQAEDEQTRALRPIFNSTMQKVADRAEGAEINVTDQAEQDVVAKFKVDRAPMPLVLALAPNGAITGGYPLKFDEQMLMNAFCSRSTWECLKALQDGKLVFLCAQNKATKFGQEAMLAVTAAKAEPQYAGVSEIVMLDPSDQTEADAVKRLGIDSQATEAMTIVIAPPVTIVNRFKGAVTKDAIVAEIKKAAAGKGGCCPGRSCGPKPPANAPPADTAGQPQPNTAAVTPQSGAVVTKPQPQAQPAGPAGKP